MTTPVSGRDYDDEIEEDEEFAFVESFLGYESEPGSGYVAGDDSDGAPRSRLAPPTMAMSSSSSSSGLMSSTLSKDDEDEDESERPRNKEKKYAVPSLRKTGGYHQDDDENVDPIAAAWAQYWGPAIRSLVFESGLLGPTNSAIVDKIGPGGAFTKQRVAFTSLAAQFVASLVDYERPAQEAYDILREISKLFTDANMDKPKASSTKIPVDKIVSKMPTMTHRCLLEYINAKRAWKAGLTELRPGPGVGVTNEKDPDYRIGDNPLTTHVGDHVRALGGKEPEELVKAVIDACLKKLSKYQGVAVEVVVDISEAPSYTPTKESEIIRLVVGKIKESPTKFARLHRLVLVTPKVNLVFELARKG